MTNNVLQFLLCLALIFVFSSTASSNAPGYQPTLFRDMSRLLRMSQKYVSELSSRKAFEDSISDSSIKETLDWSKADGLLIEVAVEHHLLSGVTRVVQGYPKTVGAGTSVKHVLANEIAKPGWNLNFGPSAGFELSEENSFFVWVTESDNELRYGVISDSFSTKLKADAVVASQDKKLLASIAKAQEIQVLENVVEKLRTSIQEQDRLIFVEDSYKDLKKSRQRLNEIRQNLDFELQKSERAQRFNQTLELMINVIDLALLVQQAKETYGDALDTANVHSGEDLVIASDRALIAIDGNVSLIERSYEFQISKDDRLNSKMYEDLKNNGAPNHVLKLIRK